MNSNTTPLNEKEAYQLLVSGLQADLEAIQGVLKLYVDCHEDVATLPIHAVIKLNNGLMNDLSKLYSFGGSL